MTPVPSGSSWSQSRSKASTLTPATASLVSQTVTSPQITHAPNRARIAHHSRAGMQYSNAATSPASVSRHCGESVVIENWTGLGAFLGGLRCGTVAQ